MRTQRLIVAKCGIAALFVLNFIFALNQINQKNHSLA
jgi:hypothetical protein